MTSMKSMMAAAGLAMSLLAGGEAKAANWYAAVDIRNPTNQTLNYSFRWGADSQWQHFQVLPGNVRTHFWNYSYADQNSSPTPQIRFHYNPGEPFRNDKTYDLQAYAVPFNYVGTGMRYFFRYSPDGNYLDLLKE